MAPQDPAASDPLRLARIAQQPPPAAAQPVNPFVAPATTAPPNPNLGLLGRLQQEGPQRAPGPQVGLGLHNAARFSLQVHEGLSRWHNYPATQYRETVNLPSGTEQGVQRLMAAFRQITEGVPNGPMVPPLSVARTPPSGAPPTRFWDAHYFPVTPWQDKGAQKSSSCGRPPRMPPSMSSPLSPKQMREEKADQFVGDVRRKSRKTGWLMCKNFSAPLGAIDHSGAKHVGAHPCHIDRRDLLHWLLHTRLCQGDHYLEQMCFRVLKVQVSGRELFF